MFRLTYRNRHDDKANSTSEYFDDIKSLGQALINIVDNEKEENAAMEWCGMARWGDKVIRQKFGYKIECFNEEELKKQVRAVANEISIRSGIDNSFVGLNNDAITYNFGLGIAYMKFNDSYGYYMTISFEDDEVWNFTSKDKVQFIAYCVEALKKFKSLRNNTKNFESTSKKQQINTVKYDDEHRAQEYINSFGIVHYRMQGHYLIYNESFKTQKHVNGKLVPSQYSVQHKVDVRDYTETHKMLKRTDPKGFDNIHN